MMKIFISVLILFLTSCASFGPGSNDEGYESAVKTLSSSNKIIFTVPSVWFPNTILGDANSYHNSKITIRMFITSEKIIAALYDDENKSFQIAKEILFSDVSWIVGKKNGRSRIFNIKTDNSIDSFIFSSCTKTDKTECNKDQIIDYVLEKTKK